MRSARCLSLLLLGACAHVGPTPDEALRAAYRSQASPSSLGVAALVQLDRGQADAAEKLLKNTRSEDALEPLLARLLLCQRNLDSPCQLKVARQLLERFPHAATSAIAAATLQRLSGESLLPSMEDLRVDGSSPHGRSSSPISKASTDCATRWQPLCKVARGRLRRPRSVACAISWGLLQDWEILGPLSSYHYLEFDTPLGPELGPGKLFAAPWSASQGEAGGSESWRPLRMNNGQIPLGHALELDDSSGEEGRGRAPQGDIVYLRTTVNANGGDLWLCWAIDVVRHFIPGFFLDGKRVLERDLFRRVLPRVQWVALPASNGPHRLLVKAAVGDTGRTLRIEAIPRSMGDLPPPLARLTLDFEASFGEGLGHALAAMAVADLDPHGALAALAAAGTGAGATGTLGLAARTELWGALDTLTEDDARGRTQRDLDSWITRDAQSPEARLRRSQIFAELNRLPLAQQDLDAVAEPPNAVLIAKARVQMQRDAIPLAIPLLRQVLTGEPGNCAALELLLTADDQANALLAQDRGPLLATGEPRPGGTQAPRPVSSPAADGARSRSSSTGAADSIDPRAIPRRPSSSPKLCSPRATPPEPWRP